MFTGIIQGLGKIIAVRPMGGGRSFSISADFDIDDPVEGESIAVNGVCLTAREIKNRVFWADVSPESLSRTSLGSLAVGGTVNLERALRLSDRLGGHLVSGHVDAVTEVIRRDKPGEFTLFSFKTPQTLDRYIVEKGSITINGISLTVNSCGGQKFAVSIIPHTLEITNLGSLRVGSMVNIEVDIIGKYVEKLLKLDTNPDHNKDVVMDKSFLAENGFMK